jgi:hypothetical protein
MKIFNLRANFSNNSSSDHSIIFIPTDRLGAIRDEIYDGDQCFGWEQFTLKSKENKLDYIAMSAYTALNDPKEDYDAAIVVKNLLGCDIKKDGYVDHQSLLTFPVGINRKINREFIKDYCEYIINNDNIIIAGGNDNGGSHPLSERYTDDQLPVHLETESGSCYFIAEKFDNYWVFLNKRNGYKTRFSFDDKASIPLKAKVPELIDIKITDYCPYNCEFCYQVSTVKGKHASLEFIKELAQELANQRVLEVALGGGEPTLHPQFIDILKIFKDHNIVVNFTTKNVKIFDNEEVCELASSMAYSVGSLEEIEAICEKVKLAMQVTFQVVMGTITKTEFEKILNFANNSYFWGERLTLLGFKPVERGLSYPKIEYDWLVHVLRDKNIRKIGFDTLLVQEFEEMLKLMEVSTIFYNSQEAAFSCYIDATKQVIAPTSYCKIDKYKPFQFDNWLETFKNFI